MLTSWIDVNNGETQSDLELNNDLASNEPERIGHPTIPRSEHVIEWKPTFSKAIPKAVLEEAPAPEIIILRSNYSKKSKKKSRFSALKAIFENN